MEREPDDEGESEPGDPRLEAAWRALEAGDLEGARAQAAELDAGSPEVLLFSAACCREADDLAGAKSLLERAAASDRQWATPELWLAEIEAADPSGGERALGHASRAVDLADDESDFLGAVALKAGIELDLGRPEDARRTLAELPPPDVALGDLEAALEISDLHLALGDPKEAYARLQLLTTSDPESADAWHALGNAAADLGDDGEMRAAWKKAWSLDAAPGAGRGAGQRLGEDEIAAVATEALEELPPRARQLLTGVSIVIAERPAEADVDAGLDPRALGMFDGTAYPDASSLGGQPGLTQIVLFRSGIERMGADREDLREEIRVTLLHETGHFFGLDDAALEALGLD